MKDKFIMLIKTKFIRNVLILASGTVLAQIITFLLLPVITRLYGPEAYGLMGSFVAIIAIIIPISALSLPIAIVLPQKRVEAIGIIKTSIKIIILVSIFSLIILLFFLDSIVSLLNAEEIGGYLYLIPFVILIAGFDQILRQWLIRNKEFKTLATVSVYQPILSHGGMVVVGFFYPVAAVLIIFSALKTGFAALLMFIKIKRTKGDVYFSLSEANVGVKHVLNKYYDFPKYRAPETLISEISHNLPVLLLTGLSGPVIAGYYALARSSLSIPVNLVTKAVGDVFYPRIVNAQNSGEDITKLIRVATLALSAVGIIPFVVIIVFGPGIFEFVFGSGWYTAGVYARWVSLMAFGMFISRPAVKSLPVLNAQRFHLNYTVITTIIRALSLIIGILVIGDEGIAIALFGSFSLLLYILLIIFTLVRSKKVVSRDV